jgi:hypothetical protein
MDEYSDVLLKLETHGNRIRNIVTSVIRKMSDTVSILIWTENVLRMNGFEDEANDVHKKMENLIESYDDIGEFVNIFVNDTYELVETHKKSLDSFADQIERIYKDENHS